MLSLQPGHQVDFYWSFEKKNINRKNSLKLFSKVFATIELLIKYSTKLNYSEIIQLNSKKHKTYDKDIQ